MITKLKNTIQSLLRQKAVILMYHQVCERASDPWELAVSPANFDEQLHFLKRNFDVVPLEDLATAVLRRKLGPRKVAITFDDGFRDNYTIAKPLLESHNLPATFYFATEAMTTGKLYWWDELELIILHSQQLPRKLELPLNGTVIKFEFLTDDTLTRHLMEEIRSWNANKPKVNERVSLFLLLWQSIQPLSSAEQQSALKYIREWAGIGLVDSSHAAVMNVRQLNEMSKNPLFTIGAHTVHHAMLGQQDAEVQAYEVQESKKVIESWVGRSVSAFSYPYGNYNSFTKLLLRDAGFRYAVSTERRVVTEQDDLFEMPRVQVKNWNAIEFSHNLENILNEK